MEQKDKKIKIMDVAEKLFAQNGFSGTSVREIAEAADVNVAMISYYFGSKENLLQDILHHRGNYLDTQIDSVLSDDTLSMWEKLDKIIDRYVQRFVDNQPLHRILLREHGQEVQFDMMAFITERKRVHFKLITDFFKLGQKKGKFATDVDLLMLYTLLPGVTKHMLFNEGFMKSIIADEEGKEVDMNFLQERTSTYLKSTFRKILLKD